MLTVSWARVETFLIVAVLSRASFCPMMMRWETRRFSALESWVVILSLPIK